MHTKYNCCILSIRKYSHREHCVTRSAFVNVRLSKDGGIVCVNDCVSAWNLNGILKKFINLLDSYYEKPLHSNVMCCHMKYPLSDTSKWSHTHPFTNIVKSSDGFTPIEIVIFIVSEHTAEHYFIAFWTTKTGHVYAVADVNDWSSCTFGKTISTQNIRTWFHSFTLNWIDGTYCSFVLKCKSHIPLLETHHHCKARRKHAFSWCVTKCVRLK